MRPRWGFVERQATPGTRAAARNRPKRSGTKRKVSESSGKFWKVPERIGTFRHHCGTHKPLLRKHLLPIRARSDMASRQLPVHPGPDGPDCLPCRLVGRNGFVSRGHQLTSRPACRAGNDACRGFARGQDGFVRQEAAFCGRTQHVALRPRSFTCQALPGRARKARPLTLTVCGSLCARKRVAIRGAPAITPGRGGDRKSHFPRIWPGGGGSVCARKRIAGKARKGYA